MRSPVENLRAFLLRYAAQDTERLTGVLPLELIQPVEYFLFGFIANTASIVQQEVGFSRRSQLGSSRATGASR